MDYFEEMATKIYETCKDMNAGDYEETKEQEISLIASAIGKVCAYGCYNDDFRALFSALEAISEEV